MADTKISALTAAGAAALTNELAINEAGTSKKVTAAQLKTLVNTSALFPGGTASAGTWPTLLTGTLLTTPESGALERDSNGVFYATPGATAGRGVIRAMHLIRANATNTLTSSTSEQKLFADPTNGRLTLGTGTYLFDFLIQLTAMSATSGNAAFDPLGAGTAVINDWLWFFGGLDATTTGNAAALGGAFPITQQTQASAISAGTGTGMALAGNGTFTVTTSGTLIPSITLVTAASAVVAIGSYFFCERIGDTSLTSVGAWD